MEKLGVDAIDKIYQDKDVLKGLKIKQSNIDLIYQVIVDNKANEETILFFLNNGISMDICHKIVATLGYNAVERVKENPYILMDKIERFGFIKNDAFALRLGIERHSQIRLRAVTLYVLKEVLYSTGDSYTDINILYDQIIKYLRDDEPLNKNLFINSLTVKEEFINFVSIISTNFNLPEDATLKRLNIADMVLKIQEIDITDKIVEFLNFDNISQYIKGVMDFTGIIFDAFVTIVVSIYLILERGDIKSFLSHLSKAIFSKEFNRKI